MARPMISTLIRAANQAHPSLTSPGTAEALWVIGRAYTGPSGELGGRRPITDLMARRSLREGTRTRRGITPASLAKKVRAVASINAYESDDAMLAPAAPSAGVRGRFNTTLAAI